MGGHEGHEGDEEEGSHEGHEGHGEESSHEGHEGDEEEGGHEGHEGDEEEVCEQDREGQPCQIDGAPWYQGEDRWRHDSQGSHQEQVRQGCEQEEVCLCQEVPMDPEISKARKALKITGFSAIKKGTPLYAKAKELYNQ